ncbi:MAG: hypothetical protein V4642_14630 [Bacteroidota bacterium]
MNDKIKERGKRFKEVMYSILKLHKRKDTVESFVELLAEQEFKTTRNALNGYIYGRADVPDELYSIIAELGGNPLYILLNQGDVYSSTNTHTTSLYASEKFEIRKALSMTVIIVEPDGKKVGYAT